MPDEDNPTPITTADLVRLFEGMSSFEKEQIAAEMALPLWSKQRGRVYRDMKDRVNTRYLVQGAEVTRDSTGNQVGLEGGKGQFDIVNFVNGTATIDSASNARQINISSGGFGSDCPDIFVDADYTGTNGATVANFFGDNVILFNNIQGAVTRAVNGPLNGLGFSPRTILIHICGGAYFEDVVFPANMGNNPIHLVAEGTAQGSNKVVVPRVQIGTGLFGSASITFNGSNNVSPGIKFNGISTLKGLQFNGGTNGVSVCPSTVFEDCYVLGGLTLNGDISQITFERTTVTGSVVDGTNAGAWRLDCRDSIIGNITCTGSGTATGKKNHLSIDDRSRINTITLQRPTGAGLNQWDLHVLGTTLGNPNTAVTVVTVRNEALGVGFANQYNMRIVDCFVQPTQMFGGEHWDVFVLDAVSGQMGGVTILGNRIGSAVGNPTTILHGVSIQGAGSVEGAVILGNNWGDENLADTLVGVVTESGGTINNSVIADNAPGSVTNSVNGTGNSTTGTGASTADAFVTIGHPADLPNSRNIAAGLALTRLDGGAGNDVTLAHDSNATSIPNAHHNALHYKDEHTTNFGRVYVPFVLIGTPPNGYTVTIT